ncbi:hypothetical protein [Nannocystis bainbridge]|uniref:Outer membrane protein beta-barrel domain-containing protein n=1 Tax=Nannocystis bainbridge TaxID=2995303 RepID=A0ABT5EB73_9BACT|nr:hypothetical protein [Nannocystis bainbridge]MDC0723109.1 hypothetical protein [Nannocystis bainbridge]
MASLSFFLVLALAPAATDRSAAPADAPTAVEAWAPAPASPAPSPTPMPMPVPVAAPTQAAPPPVAGPPPPPSDVSPPPPPPTRPPSRPDRPIRWRLDVGGDIGTTVIRDPAWRAFDSGDRSAFHAGATIRGDFRLADGRLFLGGGASFRRFGSYSDLYSSLATDITVREPLAFLRLAFVVREGFDVFAHVGGGPSFAAVGMSSWGSTYTGSYQRSVLAMADAQAGAALYLPKQWLPRRGASRVTAGFELSAGYTFRSKLRVRPDVQTDDDPIATHGSDFGDLAPRGFVWRFGLFVRFQ